MCGGMVGCCSVFLFCVGKEGRCQVGFCGFWVFWLRVFRFFPTLDLASGFPVFPTLDKVNCTIYFEFIQFYFIIV